MELAQIEQDEDLFARSREAIRDHLQLCGINFEGRELPVSLVPIDRSESFVLHMAQLAQQVSGEASPNIAICSYRGCYTNEVASFQACHALLVEQGILPGGQCAGRG